MDLDGEDVRLKETNLGDFVADILRETAKADAALINGGGISTSIPRGKIAVKDVYAVLPFDNYLVAISLTGAQVKAALEHGVARLDEPLRQLSPGLGAHLYLQPQRPGGLPGQGRHRGGPTPGPPERVRGGHQ